MLRRRWSFRQRLLRAKQSRRSESGFWRRAGGVLAEEVICKIVVLGSMPIYSHANKRCQYSTCHCSLHVPAVPTEPLDRFIKLFVMIGV